MPNLASFRAFLIGADSLLLECAALLLERGHELGGIITDAPRLRAWAREHGVRTLPLAGYPEALKAESFDYLFSITHLAMIPEAVLRLPRRAAINFHDGPLPRYAGLNAPAWALLRGEHEYGISWHLIVPGGGVDEGAVLEQRLFEIAPGETSLSLNTRNFAAAIDSFAELVDKLAAGTESPQAQDLSARSYFGKYLRPEAGCVLDLQRPAAELLSAVRALDFGDYDNPLGAPKLVHRGLPLVVRRAELRAESSAAVGCVSAVSAEALELATGDGTLLVQALTDVYGRQLTPLEAAQVWQLEPGMQLEGLAAPLREWLTEQAVHLARSEEFFLARLRSLEPATLALAQHARSAEPAVALDIPLAHPARVLAVLCAYLARTSGKTEFDLGHQAAAYPAGLEAFFAPQLPLRVRVDEGASFEVLARALETELATLATRGPCARDLCARHASLRAYPELRSGALADVALIRQRELPPGVALALAIDEGGNLQLLCDPARLPERARHSLRAQLVQLMAAAEAEPWRPIGEHSLLPLEER
ncbi:MAG TPA: formyltransferase family protein, partial [Polyangiales bacterium]|nr:formyltransferase family protein [Polyangiales bacterium]